MFVQLEAMILPESTAGAVVVRPPELDDEGERLMFVDDIVEIGETLEVFMGCNG